jgi:prophage DNA circulation protein
MAMYDQFTNSFDNALQPKPVFDFRKEIVPATFKLQEFKCVSSSTVVGRRTVVHDRPQQDVPFVEDMGGAARQITMTGFVIGDNWQQDRNELLKACQKGAGYLVHPELGKIMVICQSCNVTENQIDSFMRADFDFTFVEVPDKNSLTAYIDTAARVRDNAIKSIGTLQQMFNVVAWIQNLPNQVMDFVSGQLTNLMGVSPYELVSVVYSFNKLKNMDLTLPPALAANIAEFTGAYNFDYTDPAGTNTITPRLALVQCVKLASTPLSYPTATTATLTLQNTACQYMEMFFKQTAVIQASVAATYIDFTSYDDAQVIWTQIVNLFDEQIQLAGDTGNMEAYRLLRDCKADFLVDVKVRAPGLNKIQRIKIGQMTPGLVVAYRQYEDISREQEIIDRNKITHPGFIITDALEVLVQ